MLEAKTYTRPSPCSYIFLSNEIYPVVAAIVEPANEWRYIERMDPLVAAYTAAACSWENIPSCRLEHLPDCTGNDRPY
jgi:hypothetical protein